MPKVKIYSTSTCVFCRQEKRFLDEKNIPYEEVLVDADPSAAQEMIDLSGQMGVPFSIITKPDGTTTNIVGFYQPKFEELLGLN